MSLFNPQRHKVHLARAKSLPEDHRFLINDIGRELIDRLQYIKRNFKNILDLSSFKLPFHESNYQLTHLPPPYTGNLQLPDHHYDLIISHLNLHWVDDIVGLLIQIRKSLKADSLFIGTFFGGDTLHELRTSLMEAEIELYGGASLRTAPMTRLQDAPTVLGRAGFALPVVDTECYTVTYPSLKALIEDLRGMGETLKNQDTAPMSKKCFDRVEEIYIQTYGHEDGAIPATAEVITLTGWSS